jgi:hypothetical protein
MPEKRKKFVRQHGVPGNKDKIIVRSMPDPAKRAAKEALNK